MSTSNRIRIDFSDQDLQERVSSFLGSRHFPAFKDLEVSVDNGMVTVAGTVNSYYEKQVAMTSCQRVAGVLSLIDQIVVSELPLSAKSDSHNVSLLN